MCNGGWGACEGQALALREAGMRFFRCLARDRPSHYGGRGAFFFVVRGPVPRDLALILSILAILAILLQTR